MAESDLDKEEVLRHRYLLAGIASGPAQSKEIDEVERRFDVSLPAAYRAYLRVCGTHPPQALIGSDCTIGELHDINQWAEELIQESRARAAFPEAFFVFLMHQGYSFLYFPLNGQEDPSVYSYQEGRSEPTRAADQFSHWVGGLY